MLVQLEGCFYLSKSSFQSKAGKTYIKYNFVHGDKMFSEFQPLYNDNLKSALESCKEREYYTLIYKVSINRQASVSLQLSDIKAE